MSTKQFILIIGAGLLWTCQKKEISFKLEPVLKTDSVQFDSDDPAIWYNTTDPNASLIIGTDKEIGGGLYVFDLQGKEIREKRIENLSYPNNVDIEYGLWLNDSTHTDIAVTVEREKSKLRIYSLPSMNPIDHGGFTVFEGEELPKYNKPMGVAIYKKPETGECFVLLSRKSGPLDSTYLWQYEILVNDSSQLSISLVRKFGAFSGGDSEIEAIMVDDSLGYAYYSDELYGIRKYYADPEKGNRELAVFGLHDFKEDREGIALLPTDKGEGFILVSDQQNNSFNVYPRNPKAHKHSILFDFKASTQESDGCDALSRNLNSKFPKGIFVAMSEDRTFHLYDINKILAINEE